MRNRVEWIDEFRGLAMVLVVLEHTGLRFFGRIILAFHMPCFFFLSGYLYTYTKQSKHTLREYLSNNIYRIGIPYILYVSIKGLIDYFWVPINRDCFSILQIAVDQYWFISCLFISGLVFHILYKTIFIKNEDLTKTLVIILCWFIVGICNGCQLPFGLGQCFMALIFLTIGSCSNKLIERIYNTPLKIKISLGVMFSTVLTICIIYNFYYGDNFFMYNNSYGKIIPAVIGAIAGTFVLLIGNFLLQPVFNKYEIVKKIVLWFGTNSLLLYPAHLWGIDMSRLVRKYVSILNLNWIITFVANTCFALLVSVIIVFLSNKYFPIMGGKKRRVIH